MKTELQNTSEHYDALKYWMVLLGSDGADLTSSKKDWVERILVDRTKLDAFVAANVDTVFEL